MNTATTCRTFWAPATGWERRPVRPPARCGWNCRPTATPVCGRTTPPPCPDADGAVLITDITSDDIANAVRHRRAHRRRLHPVAGRRSTGRPVEVLARHRGAAVRNGCRPAEQRRPRLLQHLRHPHTRLTATPCAAEAGSLSRRIRRPRRAPRRAPTGRSRRRPRPPPPAPMRSGSGAAPAHPIEQGGHRQQRQQDGEPRGSHPAEHHLLDRVRHHGTEHRDPDNSTMPRRRTPAAGPAITSGEYTSAPAVIPTASAVTSRLPAPPAGPAGCSRPTSAAPSIATRPTAATFTGGQTDAGQRGARRPRPAIPTRSRQPRPPIAATATGPRNSMATAVPSGR